MDLDYEEIWNKVLDILKTEFNPVTYSTWFGKTKLHNIDQNNVTIIVPMHLHKRQFNNNYYDLISDAVTEVTGVERKLNFVLESDIDLTPENLNESVNNNEVINNKDDFVFDTNLNPALNFDNFVVGDTNKFARTASFAVAQNPGSQYNPLFIYGKSGLGKTHLMHAIGNYIVEHNPNLKVLYTRSDDFRNDYTGIANTSENSIEYANDFKRKYRDIDVLIIDDIQYLVGAEKTQEEFFHTFNELHGKNKQIIISSDRSPDDLQRLEERLRSRFAWGLPVDIYPPDFDLRCRIIKDKIKKSAISSKITDEAIEFIANNFEGDVRKIESAVNRLVISTAMDVPDIIDL
jgi:chromosomal replication initiator protein